MANPEQMFSKTPERKRIDQYRYFLQATTADEQDDFYGPIRPLIGIELSVANLDKQDMPSYIFTIVFIQEALINGLDAVGMEEMTLMTAELKLSMSQDGRVLDNIFSNRIEYTQTQNLHEYQHLPEKKGLLGLPSKRL